MEKHIFKEFANQYYENQIYINFKNKDDMRIIFDNNLDVNRILMDLSAKMPNIKLLTHKTLLLS